MAGTVIADTLQGSVSGTPPQFNDGSGTQIGTLCRAWVNFNGLSGASPVIRASFNVSSVTRNATGYYTINFTNALSDANYSVAGGFAASYGTRGVGGLTLFTNPTGVAEVAPTTSAFVVWTADIASNTIDSKYVNLSVYR